MNTIELHYAPDNASLIIRIILEELQLPYSAVLVDRSKQQQSSEQYLALNPTGLIPVCVIDGETISETAAIALFIAEHNNSSMAVPCGHANRSQFLRWLFFLANTVHPALQQVFYSQRYTGDCTQQQAQLRTLARERLANSIVLLDRQYFVSDTEYLFAAEPCVVDVYLAVCLRWLQLYPKEEHGVFGLEKYSSIRAMLAAMQQRDCVISACAKEGISGEFFTAPEYATAALGSAT